MAALPPVAGSAISVLLVAFFVWAVLSLALKRFPFRMNGTDRALAWAFTAFPAVILLTGLLGAHPAGVFAKMVACLPFLSLWVLIPRLRVSPRVDYLSVYICGAACGSMAGALVAVGQWLHRAHEAEGGMGNSAVFAIISLCLAGISALNMKSPNAFYERMSWIGLGCGLLASALAMTRGVLLAFPIVLFVCFVFAPRRWIALITPVRAICLVAILGIGYFVAGAQIAEKLASIESATGKFRQSQGVTSLDIRVSLWQGGLRALAQSPFLGYGVQNRMEAVAANIPGAGGELALRFSHAHNGFLSVALDGGILGLAAVIGVLAMPIVIAMAAPKDGDYKRRLFLAILVSAVYVIAGMTQIMFRHDIMDSFFIFNAVLIAASIPFGKTPGAFPAKG